METIAGYMARDHARLDQLLRKSFADPAHPDPDCYREFRKGLLRHIAIEEKILLPAIASRMGAPHPAAQRIRLDHGAIAALLVPPPSSKILQALRWILAGHNALEESDGGVYAGASALQGEAGEKLMRSVLDFPEVPLAPSIGRRDTLEAARRALHRAGYDFDSIIQHTNDHKPVKD